MPQRRTPSRCAARLATVQPQPAVVGEEGPFLWISMECFPLLPIAAYCPRGHPHPVCAGRLHRHVGRGRGLAHGHHKELVDTPGTTPISFPRQVRHVTAGQTNGGRTRGRRASRGRAVRPTGRHATVAPWRSASGNGQGAFARGMEGGRMHPPSPGRCRAGNHHRKPGGEGYPCYHGVVRHHPVWASAVAATELTNSPNQDFGVWKNGGNGEYWG